MSTRTHVRRLAGALTAATLAAAALTACASGTTAQSGGSVEDALEKGGKLTVWGWDATLPATVEAFEEKYPNVDVELSNVGTTMDEYSAIQNAISAGSGVPDVVHLEYSAVPQFALANSLADLSAFGAAELEDTYTSGTWSSVTMGGDTVYGLPMDSGPMAYFYNQNVFDTYGLTVPTTWDEFLETARSLHAANPDAYLVADTGDAGFTMSMIWQAGGQPFSSEGTDVTVDLQDEGSMTFATFWQKMIDEDLVAPITSWSDEWYKGLANGTIASLAIGAWMPAMLEAGVPSAAGQWRVAPLPQWNAGEDVTAENGGSALSVTEASQNKALAYGFVQFSNAGEGVQVRLDRNTFPATTADLTSEEFLGREFPFFGGQKVNEVLAASAGAVRPGWQYLPFQPYASSIFNDYVGKAYVSDTTLADGLAAWQDAIVAYGNEQGFSVNK